MLVENNRLLNEKYAGKWVAIADGKLVAVGDTAPEAAEKAEKAAPNSEYTLQAIDFDTDVIYGNA